jgi:hypothetical protein
MKNNKEKILNDFLDNKEKNEDSLKPNEIKDNVLRERTGLIERVDSDRIFVTRDGKQLLREQY